ncbi:sulfotransferase [soil metagenome]
MKRIWPLPFFSFLKIINDNGGLSAKGILHMTPWLIKTILLEPFRWIEILLCNRKIEQYNIPHAPIFILGHYRSGTTYLQRIFMQDSRFGYMSIFQMILPELMLTFEKILTAFFEKICRLLHVKNPFHRIPFTFHFPGETDVGMTTLINPHAEQWGQLFPTKMQTYFDKYVLFDKITEYEIEKWKEGYIYMIKKVSIKNRHKQLVLKSPPDTARIKILLELFPNAKFIHICRNPYDVYASTKRLINMLRNNYVLGKTRLVDFNELIVTIYVKMMNSYLEDKKLVPVENLKEIKYESFVQFPIKYMQSIYSSLNLGDFSYCENAVTDFIVKQKTFSLIEHSIPDNEKKMITLKCKSMITYWENLE